jgi:hypothetical protein
LNQMRQFFYIIFLSHRLTWWNKFIVIDSQSVEECDQHRLVFFSCFSNGSFLVCWGV